MRITPLAHHSPLKNRKFWEMHDLLFENQSSLSMERIDELPEASVLIGHNFT